jgi:hypothetical protein
MTVYPTSESFTAVALPTPVPAPVTIATLLIIENSPFLRIKTF